MSTANEEVMNRLIREYGDSILLCFLIGGTTVYAGGKFLYEKIMVNDQEVLPLDDMEVQKVHYLDATKDAVGIYETQLDDYDELRESLGVPLLNSPFTENNRKMIINYQSDNHNWVLIKATAFIVGDTTNLVLLPEYNLYNYTSGKEFGSPINLQIDIMTSKSQKETGMSRDFLEEYRKLR